MAGVKAIPDGFHSLTPHIVCDPCDKAIEFYQQALGAEEIVRLSTPDGGKIMHAEVKIGDSILMLCDPMTPECKPDAVKVASTALHLYVEDCDAVYAKAVAAGATATMPLMDAFWGDRYGQIKDPFGHTWAIATHKQDLAPEQIGQGAQEWFQKMCQS